MRLPCQHCGERRRRFILAGTRPIVVRCVGCVKAERVPVKPFKWEPIPMSDVVTLNLDCKYCGARCSIETAKNRIVHHAEEWLKKHRPCAGSRVSRVKVTTQVDAQSPPKTLLSAKLKGS